MTRTNRKEKKKIEAYSMLIVVLILLAIIGGSMLSSINFKAEIISYEQDEDFQDEDLPDPFITNNDYMMYDMSYEDAKDSVENPENYRGYLINIDIRNISWQKVYWVEANLSKGYKGIWMFRSGLAEWQIDVEPNNTYSGDIYIIVKTSDMTEKQIDELIRSIGITVSAQNVEWIPFVTSETIYFEK